MGGILPGQSEEMICGPDVYYLRVMTHITFEEETVHPEAWDRMVTSMWLASCRNVMKT